MEISHKTVEYVAELSRIKLDDKQIPFMANELSKILNYMEILKTADTENVEPLSHVFPVTNVLRTDDVQTPFERELLIQNAPEHTSEAFVVPKVVGG
jgi:aspartyl-tRNA(Asn)/glutamyl-tRNA(Gln) amidotransferase subunit C